MHFSQLNLEAPPCAGLFIYIYTVKKIGASHNSCKPKTENLRTTGKSELPHVGKAWGPLACLFGLSVPRLAAGGLPRRCIFNQIMADEKTNQKEQARQEAEPVVQHPAWETFCRHFVPAEKHQEPEYFTTAHVLERLNNIVDDGGEISESDLFKSLLQQKFTNLLVGQQLYWLMRPAVL